MKLFGYRFRDSLVGLDGIESEKKYQSDAVAKMWRNLFATGESFKYLSDITDISVRYLLPVRPVMFDLLKGADVRLG